MGASSSSNGSSESSCCGAKGTATTTDDAAEIVALRTELVAADRVLGAYATPLHVQGYDFAVLKTMCNDADDSALQEMRRLTDMKAGHLQRLKAALRSSPLRVRIKSISPGRFGRTSACDEENKDQDVGATAYLSLPPNVRRLTEV